MDTDEHIKDYLLQAFNSDPRLGKEILYAGIRSGVVTLMGEVRNEQEKSAAERIAREAEGVIAVRNYLKVPGTALDAEAQAAYSN